MIQVTFHSESKLVRAVMSGLLMVEDVERLAGEEQAAVRAMGLNPGQFLLLVETDDLNAFRDCMELSTRPEISDVPT